MARRCGTRNNPCPYPRASWWKDWLNSGGGSPYSPEAQAVFANMPDELPEELKDIIATFVDSLSQWDSHFIDFVYLGLNTADNSMKGFKGVVTGSRTGADWFKYGGVETIGAAGSFVNTGINPTNISGFDIADIGIGAYVTDNRSTGNACLMGYNIADLTQQWILFQTATYLRVKPFTNTNTDFSTVNLFEDDSFYAAERVGTNARLIKGSTSINNGTISGGTISNGNIYLGARNNVQTGVVDLPMSGAYKFYVIYKANGFDRAEFKTAFDQLNDSIATLYPVVPLVIDMGQSNSAGRAELNRLQAFYPDYNPSPEEVYIWYNSTSIQPLQIGVNGIEPFNNPAYACFGGNFSLLTLMQRRISNPVYGLLMGYGGTFLAAQGGGNPDWAPASVGENFATTNTKFLQIYAKLSSAYRGRTIKSVLLWHQGESDATVGADTTAYATNFPAFVTAFRALHSQFTTAPLIITKLYYNLNAGEATINAVFDTYVGANANAYVNDPAAEVTYPRKVDLPAGIKSTYPPTASDDNHNSYEFQIKKGEMIYEKLVEIGYI